VWDARPAFAGRVWDARPAFAGRVWTRALRSLAGRGVRSRRQVGPPRLPSHDPRPGAIT